MNIQWKTALVTWASSWLGKSISQKLIEWWAKVIGVARNKEKLENTAKELWNNFSFYQADLSDKDSLEETFDTIVAEVEAIDILINNAWIRHQWTTEEHSLDVLQQLLLTNVFWVMWVINKIFPLMKKQKKWSILTINSLAWVEGNKDWSPYCWTKHALTWYIKYFREEAAEHWIKVTQIHPWWMNTNIFETFKDWYWTQDWMMDKDNVADVVLFMLSQPDDMNIDSLVVRKFL